MPTKQAGAKRLLLRPIQKARQIQYEADGVNKLRKENEREISQLLLLKLAYGNLANVRTCVSNEVGFPSTAD